MATRPGTGSRPNGPTRRPEPSTMEATAAEEKLAAAARDYYQDQRREYETASNGVKSHYKPPRRYDGRPARAIEGAGEGDPAIVSTWLTLVRNLKRRNIPVGPYIRQCFEDLDPYARIPEPRQLYKPEMLDRWRKGEEQRDKEVIADLEAEKAIARQEIARYQYSFKRDVDTACSLTLLDECLELSPLFRYCLAVSLKKTQFAKIAKLFAVDATIQFLRDRARYLAAWKGFLPSDFNSIAVEIYDKQVRKSYGNQPS